MRPLAFLCFITLPACTAGVLTLEPGETTSVPEGTSAAVGPVSVRPVASATPLDMPPQAWAPTPASPPSPPSTIALGLGRRHSCAATKDGALHCWGAGDRGQLGTGQRETIGDDETPRYGSAVDLRGRKVVDLAAGHHHTCVLTGEGGVSCFGIGTLGQLGRGDTRDIGDDESPGDDPDVEVGGRAVAIAAGELHTCVLRDDGHVRCFGAGRDGRLGIGSTDDVGDDEHPTTDVDLGVNAVAITAGDAHTCVLSDEGRVRCWGENDDGRLGYGFFGDVGDDESPTDVGDVELEEPAVAIEAGTSHTCAILESGRISCFGVDRYGELGLARGMTIGVVDLEAPVVEVAAGNFRTCIRFESGAVRCWGYPYDGGLGVATTAFASNPRHATDAGLGVAARAIASGTDHSCAIMAGGAVRCWGEGQDGQLGYGSTESVGDDEMPSTAGDVELP